MERVVAMLPKSVVEDLDALATREGLSRSGLVRVLVIRYLREKEQQS
jgi:metal-responsive CopG/Arc/MetJ family transcriptional regulator